MKKRILALALAGTTAFSVFGAAISANAATSAERYYEVDAYMDYTPVAEKINTTTATSSTDNYAIDLNVPSKPVYFTIVSKASDRDPGQNKYLSVEDYVKYNKDVKEEYAAETLYTFTRDAAASLAKDTTKKKVDLVYYPTSKKVVVDTGALQGTVKLTGTYYIDRSADVDQYGNFTGNAYYTGTISEGDKKAFTDATGSSVTPSEYKTTTSGTMIVKDGAVKVGKETGELTGDISASGTGYMYEGNYYANANALVAGIEKGYTSKVEATQYSKVKDATVTAGDTINAATYNGLKTVADYSAKIQTGSTTTPTGDAAISVVDSTGKVWGKEVTTAGTTEHYKDWTFNSDMTGEVSVDPYTVNTTIVNGVMKVEKVATPTIYAYDFLPANMTAADAGTIAYNWNNKSMAEAAAAIGDNLVAETGRGRVGMGVRYDVVSDWIDFLDELAINKDNKGYVETKDEFVSNYTDMFYNDPVYSSWTGQLIGYNKVDLYNISGLLSDIYDLNNSASYYQANTSELVYLMQQYDKYIGNYIDKSEVSTSEWGELMLSVLNAATEDDFKRVTDYKKYVNAVEELQDAYEMATTVAQVAKAEQGMYDLLTRVPYTANTVDKTALNATMEGLYFNVGTAPTQYTTAPSTQSNNVDYSNYNYYVAVAQKTGNDYVFTTTLAKGYYSLYPMADYASASNKVEVYSGNVDKNKDFTGAYATEEYEWFWNVYQLAANMNASNKYQGSVDAINEALTEAVSNLAVTTTPYATETSAMDEMVAEYEGKIEEDYNAGYYAKYVEANDYAENSAEGKWQTRIARNMVGVAGEALTYQGTQITVTKNDMKTVETAIKNGEAALKAIKEDANYNAAQVNALNKAIANAQVLVDLYDGTYSKLVADQSVNHVYTALVGDKDQMVKSDLTKAIEAIDAAINYSEIVMGWSKNDAGKWQYGTEEGYLSNGWNKIGKTWFYFNEDGTAKQSEWLNENGTWYWFNSNCGAATGWAKVDGEWYFFKGNNAMKTGWEKVDGNWYYMASSGKMVTGWCEIGGKWYYFSKESNSLGQMLYNTTVDGYKLDANGVWVK